MGNHGFLKALVTVAAIGGVCYAFRDKIKESKVYKSLDVEDKVEKAKRTIKDKVAAKEDSDREYFTLDDEIPEDAAEAAAEGTAEAATEEDAPDDITAKVNDLLSDIPDINIPDADSVTGTPAEETTPLIYENDGLSDTSEDLDVIAEQDKLDI